jgi:type I restriction enzyme S subunit
MSRLDELIAELCPNGVEYKKLKEVASVSIGEFVHKNKQNPNGVYPVYNGGTSNTGFYDEFNRTANKIIISARGANAGFVNRVFVDFWAGNSCYTISVKEKYLDWNFTYYVLKNSENKLINEQQKGGIPAVSKKQVEEFYIPLPPLPVQQEIVRILDNFTELTAELKAELTARRKQYEYYRDLLLTFGNNPDIKWMTLGEIGPVCMCKRIMKAETSPVGDVPFFKIGTFGKEPDAFISQEKYDEYRKAFSFPKKGDILISAAGTIGRTVIYDGKPAYYQDSNIVWIDNDESKVLNKYLYYCYAMKPWSISTGGTIARLYNDNISKAKIPVPPLEEQERIVAILDRFDALCNDLTSGIPAEIEARQKQYEYYRDKLLSFKEVTA